MSSKSHYQKFSSWHIANYLLIYLALFINLILVDRKLSSLQTNYSLEQNNFHTKFPNLKSDAFNKIINSQNQEFNSMLK